MNEFDIFFDDSDGQQNHWVKLHVGRLGEDDLFRFCNNASTPDLEGFVYQVILPAYADKRRCVSFKVRDYPEIEQIVDPLNGEIDYGDSELENPYVWVLLQNIPQVYQPFNLSLTDPET